MHCYFLRPRTVLNTLLTLYPYLKYGGNTQLWNLYPYGFTAEQGLQWFWDRNSNPSSTIEHSESQILQFENGSFDTYKFVLYKLSA